MTTLVAQNCALTQSVAEGNCIARCRPSRATRQEAERKQRCARSLRDAGQQAITDLPEDSPIAFQLYM